MLIVNFISIFNFICKLLKLSNLLEIVENSLLSAKIHAFPSMSKITMEKFRKT